MPLLSDYQDIIIDNLTKYNFKERIQNFKGRCHDALIGEWINWWFLQKDTEPMICNPARQSRSGRRKYIADLLFLERFVEEEHYEVKGVAEIENNKNKIFEKINSLKSYEDYTRRGNNAYPDLEFAVLCFTLKDIDYSEKIINKVYSISDRSNLLWIICQINNVSNSEKYSIHMPEYVKSYDYFYYTKNFDSLDLYYVKNGKKIHK